MFTTNGVDIEQFTHTFETVATDRSAGEFHFVAATEWTGSSACVRTLFELDHAYDRVRISTVHLEGDHRQEYADIGCMTDVNADASAENLARVIERVEATSPRLDTVATEVPYRANLVTEATP